MNQGAREAKGKGPLSLFRQKIKISFSKSRLNETVDELRRYSKDLVTLSRQIRELSAQSVDQTLAYIVQKRLCLTSR